MADGEAVSIDDGVGEGKAVSWDIGVAEGVAGMRVIPLATLSGISESLRNSLPSNWFIASLSRVGVSGSDIAWGTLGAGFTVSALYTLNEIQTTAVTNVIISTVTRFGSLLFFIVFL